MIEMSLRDQIEQMNKNCGCGSEQGRDNLQRVKANNNKLVKKIRDQSRTIKAHAVKLDFTFDDPIFGLQQSIFATLSKEEPKPQKGKCQICDFQ
jgi:hypothetical protein